MLVQGLWTMSCRLFILLKPERLMGLGMSVIEKLFRSLGFRQTQLETYKSIIYDSYPSAIPSRCETNVFLLLYHVYRPTKRGFYSFLDNFKIEMKSKRMNAPFIPCLNLAGLHFLCHFMSIGEMNKVEKS